MLRVKWFDQAAGFCGPSSLAMVLSYHGVNKSQQLLGRLSGCTRSRGVEAEGLLKAAQTLGFRGFIKDNASIAELRHYVVKKKLPVIVDWFEHDDGHYCVVVHIDTKNIYLRNPVHRKLTVLPLKTFK